MSVTHLATLLACDDCMILVVNGEPCDERPNLENEISAHLDLKPCQHLAMGDAEHDEEFTWRACECCGSKLGGGRSELVLLEYP